MTKGINETDPLVILGRMLAPKVNKILEELDSQIKATKMDKEKDDGQHT